MAKTRKAIPKAVSEAVLKEFNHKCAVCGKERPQIHHIDEDPSNNDPLNLIPLSPNCHLIDQHNPTVPIASKRLQLFRQFKDPVILKPQFHPLFLRMSFLWSLTSESNAEETKKNANELTGFVSALEMGSYYSKSIQELFAFHFAQTINRHSAHDFIVKQARRDRQYIQHVISVTDQVISRCVELLRYQKW